MTRVVAALAVGAVLLSTPPVTRAGALHLRLLRAEPAADTTISRSPEAIRLWFSQLVQLKATSVKLRTPSGGAIELGKLSQDTTETAPVVAPVEQSLGPGSYTVAWRTMARDGHIVKGEYSFTVGGGTLEARR